MHNYGRATDTVKRRCQNCQQFAEITSEIKLKSLQGQVLSLEDLLHKPVARVQKNALVLDVSIVYCFRDALSYLAPSDDLQTDEMNYVCRTCTKKMSCPIALGS